MYVKKQNMKVGIIRYPGSNCDYDAFNFFKNSFFIWHTEDFINTDYDLLVIPGGFAFGDRVYESATGDYKVNPGEMAAKSQGAAIIIDAANRKIPIIGICNGFQILLKLGLLPGKLLLNNNGKFNCKTVNCHLKSTVLDMDSYVDVPIANSYGNYSINNTEYETMIKHDQVFLTYNNLNNGSYKQIAGVCNKDHTIYGMMPHPERIAQGSDSNITFIYFFEKILQSVNIAKHIERPIDIDIGLSTEIDKIMCSEHVSYKSTGKYLSQLYTTGENVVQGPGENAGIVRIGGGYCIALRIESHNHPVFIDPYQGAATGVGGILRDIFTMGARPIALLDFLRFGKDDYNSELIPKTIDGISYYGNCVGVPNVGGDFYRSQVYNKNPLVNVACVGLVKEENIIYGNALNKDSLIIYVGSKTGREGVGGADMASKSFSGANDIHKLKDNIQTGDAFLGKLLLEACNEIAEKKLAEGMQDLGAGGILCATIEVVERGRKKTAKNLGCELRLKKIPTKCKLTPSEMLISESQERMIIIATEKNKNAIMEVFKYWDLESDIIGTITETGCYCVINDDKIIYNKHFKDFHYPKMNWDDTKAFNYSNYALEKIQNTALWEQYDSMVGCRTIKGPLENGSYSVLNIKETGQKLIITWGSTFEECYQEMQNKKARALGLVNCLNFGHPSVSMGAFKILLEQLNESCKKYKVPVLGGNVSLYNATNDISIDPTIVLVMIGIIDY